MSKMTIFISPKGFDRPHIAMIQRNAIQSWKALGSDVDIVLIGQDAGVQEAAEEFNVRYVSDVKRNAEGTPLLSDIFDIARKTSDSPLLAYVNADIILFSDFLDVAQKMLAHDEKFLLVGQRYDLDVREPIDFSSGWEERIRVDLQNRGRLHPPGGSDYFVYPRACFETLPEFAIGRSGWDNWMFYEARMKGWKLIDCTDAIQIIHQDHDYGHLPEGKPHYRLPESARNVELAGGDRAIFKLLDCDWRLTDDGKLIRPRLTGEKMIREIEIFPLVTLKSDFLSRYTHRFFRWVKRKLKRK